MSAAAPSSSRSDRLPKWARAGASRSCSVALLRGATVAPWRARNTSQKASKVTLLLGAPRRRRGATLSANQRRASRARRPTPRPPSRSYGTTSKPPPRPGIAASGKDRCPSQAHLFVLRFAELLCEPLVDLLARDDLPARAVELLEFRDHSRRSLARVENGRRVLLRRLLVDGQGVVHARWKRRGRKD